MEVQGSSFVGVLLVQEARRSLRDSGMGRHRFARALMLPLLQEDFRLHPLEEVSSLCVE